MAEKFSKMGLRINRLFKSVEFQVSNDVSVFLWFFMLDNTSLLRAFMYALAR